MQKNGFILEEFLESYGKAKDRGTYVPRAATPSGRAVPAPRIAPAAASAVRSALQQLAAALATTMVHVIHEAFTYDTRWASLLAAVRRVATAAQAEVALAVLRDQRGKFIFADESSHSESSSAGT